MLLYYFVICYVVMLCYYIIIMQCTDAISGSAAALLCLPQASRCWSTRGTRISVCLKLALRHGPQLLACPSKLHGIPGT